MATKYKIYADEQFLGHYYASSGLDAIEKAIHANFDYHPEIIGMPECVFTSTKNGEEHRYGWINLPHLIDEFEIPREEIE